MPDLIRVKRGNRANLPTLNDGEFGLAEDTKELFIGTTSGNMKLVSVLTGGSKIQSGSVAYTPTITGFQKLGTVTLPVAHSQNPLAIVQATSNSSNISNIEGVNTGLGAFDIYGNVTTAGSPIFFAWITIGQ